jgi:hypothetical protein
MMLMFYLECGFSLLPNRKSFARGTPFLLRDVKKCQYFFINDLVHLNPTLTQVERVLPNTFVTTGLLPDINRSPRRAFLHRARPARDCMWPSRLRADCRPRGFFTVFSTVG